MKLKITIVMIHKVHSETMVISTTPTINDLALIRNLIRVKAVLICCLKH